MEDYTLDDLKGMDQTDPEVQYKIGRYYFDAQGEDRDLAQAQRWLQEAADQGHSGARELLETLLARPETPELNAETLAAWCERAESGDTEALYAVACYFLEQKTPGAERDIHRYLARAAEDGHGGACLILGKEYMKRCQFREGLAYLKNASDCGIAEADWILARYYAGEGRDPAETEKYISRAANFGTGEELVQIAAMFATGEGVERSVAKALALVNRAADKGMENAEARYDRLVREIEDRRRMAREEEALRREEQERWDSEARALEEEEAEKERKKARKRMVRRRNAALALFAAAALGAGTVAYMAKTSPAHQVAECVNKGYYELALDTYRESVAGSPFHGVILSRELRGLGDRVCRAVAARGFEEDAVRQARAVLSVLEEAAPRECGGIRAMLGWMDALDRAREDIRQGDPDKAIRELQAIPETGPMDQVHQLLSAAQSSKETAEALEAALAGGRTDEALTLLEETLDAGVAAEESRRTYAGLVEQKLSALLKEGDPEAARRFAEEKSARFAAGEMDALWADIEKRQVEEAITQAGQTTDREKKLALYLGALSIFPENEALRGELYPLLESETRQAIRSADFTRIDAWLDRVTQTLGEEDGLLAPLYKEMEPYHPVALSACTVIEGSFRGPRTAGEESADTYGNTYPADSVILSEEFDPWFGYSGGSAVYNLGRKYSTLKMTLAPESRSGEGTLSLYGDDVLLGEYPMERLTEAFDVSLKVKGISKLKLQTTGKLGALLIDPTLYPQEGSLEEPGPEEVSEETGREAQEAPASEAP